MPFEKLENVEKIAVLRAIGLGDHVFAIPALQALRETYPQAEIVYLGKPWLTPFMVERPSPVDRVVVVPVSYGVREEPGQVQDERELDAFFDQMQQEQFDLAIQMHGGGRNSNPFTKRLGAKFSIGTRTPDAIELDRWIPYLIEQNEFIRWLELVRLVGVEEGAYEPKITVIDKDFAEVERNLPGLNRYAVLHPGATDPRRRWPPQYFAAVGDALAREGFQIVVTGTGFEKAVIEQVIECMTFPSTNACERLSVGGLAGLLARAAVMVSNDTGPMHVANSVGTPNVAIFWCYNFLKATHFGRSFHRPLASWVTHCPLCGASLIPPDFENGPCLHDVSLVTEITVEEVLDNTFDLLGYVKQVSTWMPA